MRRPPLPEEPAQTPRRRVRVGRRAARARVPAAVDARRAAPRGHRCGHGAPFTLAFLVRLIESGDLLV